MGWRGGNEERKDESDKQAKVVGSSGGEVNDEMKVARLCIVCLVRTREQKAMEKGTEQKVRFAVGGKLHLCLLWCIFDRV